jgi:hydroxymethylglutaryl-CoA synthase
MAKYALSIGMDTAQGRPGDALEYTAGAGGAAFLLGPAEESLAEINASYSFTTDTPDFFRRANEKYPVHGERFTGEPAYFKHISAAAEEIMNSTGIKAGDFAYAVFHQPNIKFPQRAAKNLGFESDQIKDGMLVSRIGNTYAGSALVGLTAVLDIADPGEKILLVSYGSGAGSDAFILTTTEQLINRRQQAPDTESYISRRTEIDYATYARYRGKLVTK